MPNSLREMILSGGYAYADPEIDESRFTIRSELYTTVGIEVVKPAASDAESIRREFERRGLRHATIETLLAYGASKEFRNHSGSAMLHVRALGSVCHDGDGYRCVPAVTKTNGQCKLALVWFEVATAAYLGVRSR